MDFCKFIKLSSSPDRLAELWSSYCLCSDFDRDLTRGLSWMFTSWESVSNLTRDDYFDCSQSESRSRELVLDTLEWSKSLDWDCLNDWSSLIIGCIYLLLAGFASICLCFWKISLFAFISCMTCSLSERFYTSSIYTLVYKSVFASRRLSNSTARLW